MWMFSSLHPQTHSPHYAGEFFYFPSPKRNPGSDSTCSASVRPSRMIAHGKNTCGIVTISISTSAICALIQSFITRHAMRVACISIVSPLFNRRRRGSFFKISATFLQLHGSLNERFFPLMFNLNDTAETCGPSYSVIIAATL